MASIKDLKFDGKNFNLHTKEGMALLEKSLQELGAGRSILVDKDNNIIAGNGIVEAAGQAGLEKVKIVETTGDEIVAVKRTDMSIDSKEGREMALADNATAAADLSWDEEKLKEIFDDEELGEWGVNLDDGGVLGLDDSYSQLEGKIIADEPDHKIEAKDCLTKDEDYFDKLEKIQKIADEDLKELLLTRLAYFADINYEMVAGLWYQSNNEIKKLLENLGLVILDKNGLIENGFADLVGFNGGEDNE